MQRVFQFVGGLSSPAILIVVVWGGMLTLVAVGPIDYPAQPSLVVLAVVGVGLILFFLGYRGGGLLFDRWFLRQERMVEPSARILNFTVLATALIGIAGIGFIALDRVVLSGVNNANYATLMRCAPELVDAIALKRTSLLYLGYAMFSFAFVSLVLFLLRGEDIKWGPAILAQLSIVSPVGYALLYSGRMPILFVLVLIMAAILTRLGEGRPALPRGHYLVLKTVVAAGLLAIYSSSIWSSRQNFCAQATSLILELQRDVARREAASLAKVAPAPRSQPKPAAAPQSTDVITGADLSKRLADATAAPSVAAQVTSPDGVLAIIQEAWNVKPRGYVVAALRAGYLSGRATMTGLSTYFYLTHGVRTIDMAWHARDVFSRQWGVYQIGILSPILRVFFPNSSRPATMELEQRSAGTFGFFPTVWLAAFIDFGMVGAAIFIVIWGCVAGWSAVGTKRSSLMTPQLLLVFVLASVLLSPVQGPLGISNSALVLLSMLITGGALDVANMRLSTKKPD